MFYNKWPIGDVELVDESIAQTLPLTPEAAKDEPATDGFAQLGLSGNGDRQLSRDEKDQLLAEQIQAQRKLNAEPFKDKPDKDLTDHEKSIRRDAELDPPTVEQIRSSRNHRTRNVATIVGVGAAILGTIAGYNLGVQNETDNQFNNALEPGGDPGTSQADPSQTPTATTTPVPTVTTASPSPSAIPTYPTTTEAVTKTVSTTKLFLSQTDTATDWVDITAKLKFNPKNKTVEVVDGQGRDKYYNNAVTKQVGAPQPLYGDKAYAPKDLEVTDLETGEMVVYPLDVNQSATTDKSITQSFSTGPIKLSDGSKDLSITYDTPDDPGSNIKSVKIGEVDFGL